MIIGHDSNATGDTFDLNTFQGYDPTCAIRSQQLILRDFGIQIPQDELTDYSQAKGWYDESGTKVSAIGGILDTCGVSVHCSIGNNVTDLIDEIKQGHRVIVGVDARELYAEPGSAQWEFFHNLNSPDHALIVAGIKVDSDNPENNTVVLTDPGKGDTYIEYPLNHFVGAWGDSQFFMMATDDAAPYQYNEETQCMEYSNFATNYEIQDFPFHNDFSSIYEFDEYYDYEPLYGHEGIGIEEFSIDEDDMTYNAFEDDISQSPYGSIGSETDGLSLYDNDIHNFDIN